MNNRLVAGIAATSMLIGAVIGGGNASADHHPNPECYEDEVSVVRMWDGTDIDRPGVHRECINTEDYNREIEDTAYARGFGQGFVAGQTQGYNRGWVDAYMCINWYGGRISFGECE